MKTHEESRIAGGSVLPCDDNEPFERFIALGKPKRRRLAPGETVPVPGYEFLGVSIAGEMIEVLEFDNGEIGLMIPSAEGLAKAVFSLVILDVGTPFTHRHLRYVRRHLGMTQQKLADSIGVRRQTVVEYEKNEHSFDKAVELAVRFIALPTALNYLPAKLRKQLQEPLRGIQEFYAHLDELVIPVDGIRGGLSRSAEFRVKLDREKPCGV